MRIPFMRLISWYLVAAMFIIAIVPRVEAGFSPSEIIDMQSALTEKTDREADLEKIQKVIETKAVSKRLKALGFSQEEINKRLANLSDRQLHQLALKIDDLKVGGNDALGVIIALLIIAILVVFLLQLTGHRVIVTK